MKNNIKFSLLFLIFGFTIFNTKSIFATQRATTYGELLHQLLPSDSDDDVDPQVLSRHIESVRREQRILQANEQLLKAGQGCYGNEFSEKASWRPQYRENVQQAITSGANINAIDANGYSALDTACEKNDYLVTKILLQKGAIAKGKTLLSACDRGHLRIIKLLLAAGADANYQDDNGLTPIYCATQCEAHIYKAEIIRLLLLYGARETINLCPNFTQDTPLHKACSTKHFNSVKALLMGGAFKNIYTKNDEKQTPLDVLCSKYGNGAGSDTIAIVKLFLNLGVEIPESLKNNPWVIKAQENNPPVDSMIARTQEEILIANSSFIETENNQTTEIVNFWKLYFANKTWQSLVEGVTPFQSGCGSVYVLPGVTERPNESLAIADMRNLKISHPHYHNIETEIYFVLQGTGTVVVAGKEIKVKPGSVVVTQPGNAHFTVPSENHDLVMAVVNNPPFNIDNFINLEETNTEVGFNKTQYNTLKSCCSKQ